MKNQNLGSDSLFPDHMSDTKTQSSDHGEMLSNFTSDNFSSIEKKDIGSDNENNEKENVNAHFQASMIQAKLQQLANIHWSQAGTGLY